MNKIKLLLSSALQCIHMLQKCFWLFATVWTVAFPAPCWWYSQDKITGVGCWLLLQESSWPRDWPHVSNVSSTGRLFLLSLGPSGIFTRVNSKTEIKYMQKNIERYEEDHGFSWLQPILSIQGLMTTCDSFDQSVGLEHHENTK